jgi:hypothetical protein
LALSFALRYAGLNGQANAFENFVKNKQFDIQTRAPEIAVNAFSGADGRFGFQIGPRLQALGNPSSHNGASGMELQRQSFPALLIVALDATDLQPVLWQQTNGNIVVLEPQVRFTQVQRWTPLNHYYFRDNLVYRIFQPKNWFTAPITEERRLGFAAQLYQAQQRITNSTAEIFSPGAKCAVLKRISNLESDLVGEDGKVFLDANDIVPQTKPATFAMVTNVSPRRVLVSEGYTNLSLVFFGTGLEQVRAGTGTNSVEFVNTEFEDSSLVDVANSKIEQVGQVVHLTAPVMKAVPTNGLSLVFKLHTTNTTPQDVLTVPVVVYTATNSPPLRQASFNYAVSSGAGGWLGKFLNGNSTNYTVTISTNASESEISAAKDLIKADLEKNKRTDQMAPNTVLDVRVNK